MDHVNGVPGSTDPVLVQTAHEGIQASGELTDCVHLCLGRLSGNLSPLLVRNRRIDIIQRQVNTVIAQLYPDKVTCCTAFPARRR